MKKVLFFSNTTFDMVKFRGLVIENLVNNGYEVVMFTPSAEKSILPVSFPQGARHIEVNFSRFGINPFSDLFFFFRLVRLYKRERPDYIFHYTIKPNIYGTLAARLCGIPSVAMITGLGYAMNEGRFINKLAYHLYKFATKRANKLLVLNEENYNFIKSHHFARPENIIWLKGGEGLDVNAYPVTDNTSSHTTFLLVGRLLKAKGYLEFVEAAKIVRKQYDDVSFQILGPLDHSNPDRIDTAIINNDVSQGIIDYLGTTNHIEDFVSRPGTVIVLPSYAEGLSRALMEACAMARPIITTDIPGCRETVIEGGNGYLVPPKNAKALANAMLRYLALSDKDKSAFSKTSRKIAEEKFQIQDVIRCYYELIQQQ